MNDIIEEYNKKLTGEYFNFSVNYNIEVIERDGELIYCYIPATDTYFATKNEEDIKKIGKAVAVSVVQAWHVTEGEGYKDFINSK